MQKQSRNGWNVNGSATPILPLAKIKAVRKTNNQLKVYGVYPSVMVVKSANDSKAIADTNAYPPLKEYVEIVYKPSI